MYVCTFRCLAKSLAVVQPLRNSAASLLSCIPLTADDAITNTIGLAGRDNLANHFSHLGATKCVCNMWTQGGKIVYTVHTLC